MKRGERLRLLLALRWSSRGVRLTELPPLNVWQSALMNYISSIQQLFKTPSKFAGVPGFHLHRTSQEAKNEMEESEIHMHLRADKHAVKDCVSVCLQNCCLCAMLKSANREREKKTGEREMSESRSQTPPPHQLPNTYSNYIHISPVQLENTHTHTHTHTPSLSTTHQRLH